MNATHRAVKSIEHVVQHREDDGEEAPTRHEVASDAVDVESRSSHYVLRI
jgi:hypothetical protein